MGLMLNMSPQRFNTQPPPPTKPNNGKAGGQPSSQRMNPRSYAGSRLTERWSITSSGGELGGLMLKGVG